MCLNFLSVCSKYLCIMVRCVYSVYHYKKISVTVATRHQTYKSTGLLLQFLLFWSTVFCVRHLFLVQRRHTQRSRHLHTHKKNKFCTKKLSKTSHLFLERKKIVHIMTLITLKKPVYCTL